MMDLPSPEDIPHDAENNCTPPTLCTASPSTTNSGESQTPPVNPFLIEVVLENLFKYCNKEALDQSRLVCKLWHQVSLPFWTKKQGTIFLNGDDQHSNYPIPELQLSLRDNSRPSMSTFLGQVHSSTLSPYDFSGVRKAPKFNIEYLTPGIDAATLESFRQNCGPWITHLKLTDFYCNELSQFKDIVCSRFTPNLKVLTLEVSFDMSPPSPRDKGSSVVDSGYAENKHLKSLSIRISVKDPEDRAKMITEFPMEWEQMLILYPNLKFLGISHVWRTFQSEFKRMLGAILSIRKNYPEKLESLKSIDMLHDEDATAIEGELIDSSVVQLLQQPLLKFSSLGLRFDRVTNEQMGILRDILTFHGSLKKLSLFMPMSRHTMRLGSVPHLEVLHAYGFPFSSLSFLRSFPNLRSLKLKRDTESSGEKEGRIIYRNTRDEAMVQLPVLTEFNCNYKFGIRGPDIVQFLKLWTPNITILKMVMDDNTFTMVCEHFPNLEELVVWGDGVSDTSIVGRTRVGKPPVALLMRHFYKPDVTAFQRLKSFEMDMTWKVSNKFSKLSIVHGFVKLPLLQHLKIHSRFGCVRPSVCRALNENLPFAKIY